MRSFYVGTRDCGCMTAMMVHDETTTEKEIREFYRDMQRTRRGVRHITVASLEAVMNCPEHPAGPPRV